jgi:porin
MPQMNFNQPVANRKIAVHCIGSVARPMKAVARWIAASLILLPTVSTCLGQVHQRLSCDEPCDALVSSCSAANGHDSAFFPVLAGLRSELANSGITFQNNFTQFYLGNTAGGIERDFRYSGHGDYVTNFDFGKLGVQEGLFLKLRAEHRFGETLRGATGAVYPVNLAADLPAPEDERLLLTNVLITQALSENFVLFAGKLDTLDGDLNRYAHGRGVRQFLNTAFVANPIALRTIPYSTLGAGFAFLFEGEPLLSFTVLNATDTVTTDGFSELFAEGAAVSAELRLPTNFFDLPGHQLFAGTWSSRNFVALDQDPRVVLPNIPIGRQSGSWSLYWNCDQALVGDEERNWGYFARAGIADDASNPVACFLSAGIGGNSPLANRQLDSFGIGYFYSGTSNQIAPLLSNVLGGFEDGQGVELFYNVGVNRSLTITPDLQILDSARPMFDTALVAGLRANLAF